jgi:glycosyltransferase involved in cell wall biosynthesis
MSEPKVLHVSFSDRRGGAAIAAERLVRAQRAAGMAAEMLVLRKFGEGDFVRPADGLGIALRVRVASAIARRAGDALCRISPGATRSIALVPTGIGAQVNRIAPDIVHWHWVGGEMISLAEMARVKAPGVWTLHDQWAFCGAEHYASDERFAEGYATSRPFDVDAWTFRRKQAAWRDWRPHLVCPSNWMARELRKSLLMGRLPSAVIPNTLDTNCFVPNDRQSARAEFALPARGKVVMFGADGGTRDPRKGFDLLVSALEHVAQAEREKIVLVTFGGRAPAESQLCGMRHIEVGQLREAGSLARLYSAADVFIAPSRQDNLPNTLLEAQACGTPCVAFRIGGMEDIVSEQHHGRLIAPFNVEEMAKAIVEAPAGTDINARLPIRVDAVKRFGQHRIAQLHRELYSRLLGS